MVDGRQYLLSVLEYFEECIEKTRLDAVIQDIGLGLWRADECLQDVPPETVRVIEKRLLRVRDLVLRGVYTDALIVLSGLRRHVLARSTGEPRRSAVHVPVALPFPFVPRQSVLRH